MKLVFAGTTLIDDTASPAIYGVIEEFAGSAKVQKADLYNSTSDAIFARGDVSGVFGCTSECSYASLAAALTALNAIYNLLNTQGSLVLTYGTSTGSTCTMANAVLRSIQRVRPPEGVAVKVRYTFDITTVVNS